MQPTLNVAWTSLRDQLVAAGAYARGGAVLLPRANRAVAITSATITGYSCVVVLAPISRVAECDVEGALHLARDLEIGAMVIVKEMLALRHAAPIADVTFDGIITVATVLARTAELIVPAVTERTRTRSIAASSAFAYQAE
jgi:hypothetical protein